MNIVIKCLLAVFTTCIIFLVLTLLSCTYNISMSHTSGGSSDETEDTSSNTPNISPIVNLPLTPISK